MASLPSLFGATLSREKKHKKKLVVKNIQGTKQITKIVDTKEIRIRIFW